MEIAQQPPIVHTAYNPVVLKLTNSTATPQSITINPGTPITMQRYPLNNNTLFEISTILKNLFEDTVTTSTLSTQVQIDHNLFVDYTLTAGGEKLIAEKTSIMAGADLKTIGATWTIEKTGLTITAYFGDDGEIYFQVTDPSPYISTNNKIKIKAEAYNTTATSDITNNTLEFDPYTAGDTLMTGSDLKTFSPSWTIYKTGVTTTLAFAPINYAADGTSAVAPTDKLILSVTDSGITNDTHSRAITSIPYTNSYTLSWPTNFSRDIQFNAIANNYFTASANTITAVKKGTLKIDISAFALTILFQNDYTYGAADENGHTEGDQDPVTIRSASGTITVGTQTIPFTTGESSDNEAVFTTTTDDEPNVLTFSMEAGDVITLSYTLSAVAKRESNNDFVFSCTLSELIGTYNIQFTDESGATIYFKVKDISGTPLTQTDALHKTTIPTDGIYNFSLDFENLFSTITSQTLQLEVYELNPDNTQQLVAHTTCYYLQDSTFTNTDTRTYTGRPFYNLLPLTTFTIRSTPSANNSLQNYGTALWQTIKYTISAYNADTPVEIATTNVVYVYNPTFVSPTTRTYNGAPFYTINHTFSAINAVAQLAETSDLTPRRGTFLTRQDSLLLYPGYPRQVSCLGFKNGTHVNLGGMPLNPDGETPFTQTLFNVLLTQGNDYIALSNQYPSHYLQAGTGEIITTNLRDEIITIANPATGYTEHRLAIQNTCTPLNPFYVRWINRQGGYDYWMFSFRQTIKEKVKITDTYTPVVYDQSTATAFSRTLGVEGTATITVGASGLTDNQYQALSKIIYAPSIQYFDTDKSTWITLAISDSDVEEDTYASTQEIEITFQLPTPQVQF